MDYLLWDARIVLGRITQFCGLEVLVQSLVLVSQPGLVFPDLGLGLGRLA